MAWLGWPDVLGAALGAFVVYPLLAWKYGAVKVTDALMFRPRGIPATKAGTAFLALYGMGIAAVFGLLIGGLILRVLFYEPTIASKYVPMAG